MNFEINLLPSVELNVNFELTHDVHVVASEHPIQGATQSTQVVVPSTVVSYCVEVHCCTDSPINNVMNNMTVTYIFIFYSPILSNMNNFYKYSNDWLLKRGFGVFWCF